MNKKTMFSIITILGISLCLGGIVFLGIYAILNIPAIRSGLDGAGQEFNAMLDLRQKILEEYQTGDVSIQIMNGNILKISLINSEFNQMSNAQQAEGAHDIALFVKNNYTGEVKIEQIGIIFVQNNQVGPINTNWSKGYSFDISDLND